MALFIDRVTAQLERLQQINQDCIHSAIQKWESAFQCPLRECIWTEAWVPEWAAKENTFLWLILFRALICYDFLEISKLAKHRSHCLVPTMLPRPEERSSALYLAMSIIPNQLALVQFYSDAGYVQISLGTA